MKNSGIYERAKKVRGALACRGSPRFRAIFFGQTDHPNYLTLIQAGISYLQEPHDDDTVPRV